MMVLKVITLSYPDCIQCGKCIKACPKKAIGYGKVTLNEQE
jgi:ferredoxin-type protein NapH